MHDGAITELSMPATYGRHLARLFPADRLLAGTGLSIADIDDTNRRITVRQALRYIKNAIELAARPEWYLEWAGTLADHFHGPISVALMSAPTLGDGLDAFLRYFPGRIPYLHMQGHLENERFIAVLCPLIDLGRSKPLLVETPLIILQQYLHTGYAVDFARAAIELDYPPTPYAGSYERYFRCPVHFGRQRNALVVPRAWRDMPNLGYIASTWAHALQQCELTLGSSLARHTLGQVRAYLSTAFELKDRKRALPTLEAVAAGHHLSARTLMRRLRATGTTYQQVMDEFLKARARELLDNEKLKVKEVAAALGFENPANFGKAFKRWYGVSPGTYRARVDRMQIRPD